jgi:hypothetical protein
MAIFTHSFQQISLVSNKKIPKSTAQVSENSNHVESCNITFLDMRNEYVKLCTL